MIQILNTNWRTTYAGLAMIIGSVVHLVFAVKGARADENTWTTALLAVAGGLGLIFARDSQASAVDKARTNGKIDALTNDVAQVKGDTSKLSKPNIPNPS